MTNIPHNTYKLMKLTTTNKGLLYFFAAIWYGLHLGVRIIWGCTATCLALKDLALLRYLNFYWSYAIVTGRDFKDFLTFLSQKFSGR
ncbi:hypothetical protein Micbo1qcDRAFT_210514 [Microdochium bolleyi]|uniref:Uncharacterized protein n=1 Tax=Microdochium bolleyi TaxID=196109 RepID=A0A136II93_9PEZI|nr:hypothetical protein Micbo1qcDRAFT_210514 [Microdochium bolleyi]